MRERRLLEICWNLIRLLDRILNLGWFFQSPHAIKWFLVPLRTPIGSSTLSLLLTHLRVFQSFLGKFWIAPGLFLSEMIKNHRGKVFQTVLCAETSPNSPQSPNWSILKQCYRENVSDLAVYYFWKNTSTLLFGWFWCKVPFSSFNTNIVHEKNNR